MSPRRYNRRSRLAAAEATRQRIVRATVALHAENGALGTTHEMIAHRADFSLPTVYKYFPTRNDLLPACTGLVQAQAPIQLDASLFGAAEDAPARLRLLARRTFEYYDYAAPWLRWAARDAAELPALRAFVEAATRGRLTLIRAALAPAFDRTPPRRLVALANVLLDFASWQSLTATGFTSLGAAKAVGASLVSLYSETRKERTP